VTNKSSENILKLKCLAATMTKKESCVQGEIRSSWESGNNSLNSAQNLLFPIVMCKIVNIKARKAKCYFLCDCATLCFVLKAHLSWCLEKFRTVEYLSTGGTK
jgi:hypothetical protein